MRIHPVKSEEDARVELLRGGLSTTTSLGSSMLTLCKHPVYTVMLLSCESC